MTKRRDWLDAKPNLLPETEWTFMTPAQASERTGIDEETIIAGLKCGAIDGIDLDEEGWLVTPEDVLKAHQNRPDEDVEVL